MRTLCIVLLTMALAAHGSEAFAAGTGSVQLKPGAVENFGLSVSVSHDAEKYLGISGKGPFKLTGIKADLVIVEFFSMYCPYCQAEAPVVNRLFDLIAKAPALKNRVKIVGIGMGNTPFEVDVFRKKYKIPFPLVPDENYASDRMVAHRFRTPTFLTFSRSRESAVKVVDIHVGQLGKPEEFLERITRSMTR